MKLDFLVHELLDESSVIAALEAIEQAGDKFSSLASELRLEPSSDFRFSNLVNVDFSYSDLRGFDFTGADLSGSYGVDIKIDDTTIFEGAEVRSSVFASLTRERRIFRTHGRAGRYYDYLMRGDPYEISLWLQQRYKGTADRHGVLGGMEPDVASALCQKLLMDDIDLTKRTSLFYYLKKFTPTVAELRETVLAAIGFHIENEEVIRSFTKVASDILRNDPFVARTLFRLCKDYRPNVREAAFLALSGTGFFNLNIVELEKIFLSNENSDIRKTFIISAARKLGRDHITSVCRTGTSFFDSKDQILDYPELADIRAVEGVHNAQNSSASRMSEKRILECHEEILATASVISSFFAAKDRIAYKVARENIKKDVFKAQQEIELKISKSYSRGWSG